MAKAAATRQYPLGVEELLTRAEAAGAPLGYSAKRIDAAAVQLKEPASSAMFIVSLLTLGTPVSWFLWLVGFGHTMTVRVRAVSEGSQAECVVTSWGLGPVASTRARKALDQLLSALDPEQTVYMFPDAP